MTRRIVSLFIIVFICFTILFAIWRWGSSTTTTSPLDTPPVFPVAPLGDNTPRIPIPNGKTFSIKTPAGPIEVNNFIPQSTPILGYDGFYIVQTDAYTISYFSQKQGLLISITQAPVLELKERAEKELLRILNISPEQACKLHVEVRTMISVDPDLAGRELGLSFCNSL